MAGQTVRFTVGPVGTNPDEGDAVAKFEIGRIVSRIGGAVVRDGIVGNQDRGVCRTADFTGNLNAGAVVAGDGVVDDLAPGIKFVTGVHGANNGQPTAVTQAVVDVVVADGQDAGLAAAGGAGARGHNAKAAQGAVLGGTGQGTDHAVDEL